MDFSKLYYVCFLSIFSLASLSYTMEETRLKTTSELELDHGTRVPAGSNLNTNTISSPPQSRSQAAHQAIDFENSVAVEILRRGGFYHFTQEIAFFQGKTWRAALPFVQFDCSRELISLDGYVLPRYLSINDFAKAGQPYFYSYDSAGRPFIAFLAREHYVTDTFDGNYNNPIIHVYYYSPAYETWFIEGGVHDTASIEDFSMLATLINVGESRITTSNFTVVYKLIPQEELEKCAQAEEKSKKRD